MKRAVFLGLLLLILVGLLLGHWSLGRGLCQVGWRYSVEKGQKQSDRFALQCRSLWRMSLYGRRTGWF